MLRGVKGCGLLLEIKLLSQVLSRRLPVVFLAFANEREGGASYLRNLPEEQRRVRNALAPAEAAGHCEVAERNNATLGEILDLLQTETYRGRVAILHFGGHAGKDRLILETPEGRSVPAFAAGLAAFLGQQDGLILVFLNGCSTQAQVVSRNKRMGLEEEEKECERAGRVRVLRSSQIVRRCDVEIGRVAGDA